MAKRKVDVVRKELDDLLGLIKDKLFLAEDFDDQDADSLDELAHRLEGIEGDCRKAADVAGELELIIRNK